VFFISKRFRILGDFTLFGTDSATNAPCLDADQYCIRIFGLCLYLVVGLDFVKKME
jgi:hypothetical protein